jgi:hypothetical protein
MRNPLNSRAAKPDWIACVHEAGHAVLAHLAGGRITDLWVDRYGEMRGMCCAEFDESNVEGLMLFLMGGFWAQHHIAEYAYPWGPSFIDQHLWTRTMKLHRITKAEKEVLWQQAEQLVLTHRRLIRHTAKRLMRHKNTGEIVQFLRTRPYLEDFNEFDPSALRRCN